MGEVLAVRDAYRAQEWAALIQEYSASGLTKREVCQQRGISEKSFYYWLGKLRTQMVEDSAPHLVPLAVPEVIRWERVAGFMYAGREVYDDIDVDTVRESFRE